MAGLEYPGIIGAKPVVTIDVNVEVNVVAAYEVCMAVPIVEMTAVAV